MLDLIKEELDKLDLSALREKVLLSGTTVLINYQDFIRYKSQERDLVINETYCIIQDILGSRVQLSKPSSSTKWTHSYDHKQVSMLYVDYGIFLSSARKDYPIASLDKFRSLEFTVSSFHADVFTPTTLHAIEFYILSEILLDIPSFAVLAEEVEFAFAERIPIAAELARVHREKLNKSRDKRINSDRHRKDLIERLSRVLDDKLIQSSLTGDKVLEIFKLYMEYGSSMERLRSILHSRLSRESYEITPTDIDNALSISRVKKVMDS